MDRNHDGSKSMMASLPPGRMAPKRLVLVSAGLVMWWYTPRRNAASQHRDANFAFVAAGIDPDPSGKDAITRWCIEYFDAVHPYSAGGAYVNFMMEEGQERVAASFRDNYDRLRAIKAKYDPSNFFRVNQNIRPA